MTITQLLITAAALTGVAVLIYLAALAWLLTMLAHHASGDYEPETEEETE